MMFPFVVRMRLILVWSLSCQATLFAAAPFRYPEAKHGRGELKYVAGVPVLCVEGTPAEMGDQLGVLALKPATPLLKSSDDFIKAQGWESIYATVLKTGHVLLPRFPREHVAELDAAAKSSGWSRDLLIFGNSVPDLRKLTSCSALIVEPARSATGAPLFGRNLDWPPFDPLHEFTLVVVYRPQGKHAFASIGYPGMFGCFSGMNDAGLALADLTVTSAADGSAKLNLRGTPYTFLLRRILEECATVEDAERLVRSLERTTMQNVAICDKRHGAVLEMTTKTVALRRGIGGVCACTNHFRTAELATSTECSRYATLTEDQPVGRYSVADVAKRLDAVNQGAATLQTMIFEPASLQLHLAYGPGPATRLPLATIDLVKLLREGTANP